MVLHESKIHTDLQKSSHDRVWNQFLQGEKGGIHQ